MKTKLINDIERARKSLLNRAKKKGLWENFGDKEQRKIEDKYDYNSIVYGDDDERAMAERISRFRVWCANVNDEEVRNA